LIFGGWVAGWPGYNMNMVQKYPRKIKPPSRVHARHRRQTTEGETDGFVMPLAKHNVVTFG